MSSIAAAAAGVGDESLRYFRVSIGEASRNKPGVIVREEECVTDCKLVGVKRDLRSASWSFAIRCRSSVFSIADFGILLKFRSASLETVAARSVVEFSVNPIELSQFVRYIPYPLQLVPRTVHMQLVGRLARPVQESSQGNPDHS